MSGLAAPGWTLRRTLTLVERNALISRRSPTIVASSVVEPLMYLLSVGIGVGTLVGSVPGVHVRYAVFVAPAILATTAMNTALNQTGFGVFSRIRNDRTYDAIVPTPVSVTDIAFGEVLSAVLSGAVSSAAFLVCMLALGVVHSAWVVLALPGALVIGFAFAAVGLAVTTFLRDFADFQLVQLVMLPMFLFATTFYPLSIYPAWLRPLIQVLPLYHAIELVREPALGSLHWGLLVSLAYLLAFGALALALASRRMAGMLLH